MIGSHLGHALQLAYYRHVQWHRDNLLQLVSLACISRNPEHSLLSQHDWVANRLRRALQAGRAQSRTCIPYSMVQYTIRNPRPTARCSIIFTYRRVVVEGKGNVHRRKSDKSVCNSNVVKSMRVFKKNADILFEQNCNRHTMSGL